MVEKVKRNIVSDASKLPTSDDPKEILKQVEFYFSDENLPTDRFLWTTAEKCEGWVPIETIHQFKRMRRFQPYSAVVEALKQSPKLLEVSEDGTKVRRRIPIVEPSFDARNEVLERTVYVKGFGEETPTSQFDIEAFFEKFGEIRQVRLRRAEDGTFKSSVFVEFALKDDAKTFVDMTPKPKFCENDLLIMSKKSYIEMKVAQRGFTDNATGKRRRGFNAFSQHRSGSNNKGAAKKELSRGTEKPINERSSKEENAPGKSDKVPKDSTQSNDSLKAENLNTLQKKHSSQEEQIKVAVNQSPSSPLPKKQKTN